MGAPLSEAPETPKASSGRAQADHGAATPGGANPATNGNEPRSIGEVLEVLREEFPDVTVSKIRFLESQGLLTPQRSASGYRIFGAGDIGQLRWILTVQRDAFIPLKVIKERIESGNSPSADELVNEWAFSSTERQAPFDIEREQAREEALASMRAATEASQASTYRPRVPPQVAPVAPSVVDLTDDSAKGEPSVVENSKPNGDTEPDAPSVDPTPSGVVVNAMPAREAAARATGEHPVVDLTTAPTPPDPTGESSGNGSEAGSDSAADKPATAEPANAKQTSKTKKAPTRGRRRSGLGRGLEAIIGEEYLVDSPAATGSAPQKPSLGERPADPAPVSAEALAPSPQPEAKAAPPAAENPAAENPASKNNDAVDQNQPAARRDTTPKIRPLAATSPSPTAPEPAVSPAPADAQVADPPQDKTPAEVDTKVQEPPKAEPTPVPRAEAVPASETVAEETTPDEIADDRLAAAETGTAQTAPAQATPSEPEAPTAPVGAAAAPNKSTASSEAGFRFHKSHDSMTGDELSDASGLTLAQIEELEKFGLLTAETSGGGRFFDAASITIARLAAECSRHGIEARHLRAYRVAADREVGLFEQIVMPVVARRDRPEQAAATLQELAQLGQDIRSALLSRALGDLIPDE
jgi:DNA-binding transcriptional MerR regulator